MYNVIEKQHDSVEVMNLLDEHRFIKHNYI